MSRAARVLLICDDRRGHANTVLDHIDAFRSFSRHQVRTFNPKAMKRSLALNLDDFDVVVVHYSIVLSDPIYISPYFRDRLRRFSGLKILFIQDDYRWVDRATAAARDIGVNVLFTVAPEPAAGQLYDDRLPGVRRVHTLTGYVPDSLKNLPARPLRQRTIDVGYRARDLPFWFGALSREKVQVGQRFVEFAAKYDLRCDIAWREHDRIYGSRWVEFLSSCRTTLGCESGASIADFDGSVEQTVRGYLRSHPGATYEETHQAVLRPYEGNVVVNVVSPRVFEAVALGTAMVMFPGQYSGVVSAGEHYIELKKDFSNMDDVVASIRDDDLISELAARAHRELIESGKWSYQAFISEFDRVVDEEAAHTRGPGRAPRWRLARAERSLRVPGLRVRFFNSAYKLWGRALRHDSSQRLAIEYESQVQKAFYAMRIVATDGDLRPLLRRGRGAGVPLDRLLREIMELSLLRRAATGALRTVQRFDVTAEYDPVRRSVCFVSTPPDQNRLGAPIGARIRDALHDGDIGVIEWDHRAMGGRINLERPAMEVGIGYEGLENFTALTALGRDYPSLLERALAPLLATRESRSVTDSVG